MFVGPDPYMAFLHLDLSLKEQVKSFLYTSWTEHCTYLWVNLLQSKPLVNMRHYHHDNSYLGILSPFYRLENQVSENLKSMLNVNDGSKTWEQIITDSGSPVLSHIVVFVDCFFTAVENYF